MLALHPCGNLKLSNQAISLMSQPHASVEMSHNSQPITTSSEGQMPLWMTSGMGGLF